VNPTNLHHGVFKLESTTGIFILSGSVELHMELPFKYMARSPHTTESRFGTGWIIFSEEGNMKGELFGLCNDDQVVRFDGQKSREVRVDVDWKDQGVVEACLQLDYLS
jgi:hypothetical protein